MDLTSKTVSTVALKEQEQISRLLLAWLNQYPDKPVTLINYEYLDDGASMALSTIQAAYKTKKYITGGYQAQYQFKVIYRLSPGSSNNNRLKADELLNALGNWATTRENLPVLGDGIRCLKVEATTLSSLFARYDNGYEDHQILMNMYYEVI